MTGQTEMRFATPGELVVTLEHDVWGKLGVFIDRAGDAVSVMAVDGKGQPTGRGLRLRSGQVPAFQAALSMAKNRLDQGRRGA